MNDKIVELARRAGFYIYDNKILIPTTSEDITEEQHKFAKLLITNVEEELEMAKSRLEIKDKQIQKLEAQLNREMSDRGWDWDQASNNRMGL